MQNADTQGGLRVFTTTRSARLRMTRREVVGFFPGAGEYSALPEDGAADGPPSVDDLLLDQLRITRLRQPQQPLQDRGRCPGRCRARCEPRSGSGSSSRRRRRCVSRKPSGCCDLDEGAAGAIVRVAQQVGDVQHRRRGDARRLQPPREIVVVAAGGPGGELRRGSARSPAGDRRASRARQRRPGRSSPWPRTRPCQAVVGHRRRSRSSGPRPRRERRRAAPPGRSGWRLPIGPAERPFMDVVHEGGADHLHDGLPAASSRCAGPRRCGRDGGGRRGSRRRP